MQASDFDTNEMESHEDRRRGIHVVEINRAFDLNEFVDFFSAAKPLNAAFEIAPDNMPKVIFCKLIALMFRPSGKAQVQVDENDMFAAAGKRI